jgi:NADPH:quinone reductase
MTDGRGVDVVLDPLGDWIFDEAIRGLAPEGRILVIGFAAGGIPNLRVNRLLLRNISAVGVAWGTFLDQDPTLMGDQTRSLNDMFRAGAVRPHIGARYRFEEIPDALRLLKEGRIPGKAVVEMSGSSDDESGS